MAHASDNWWVSGLVLLLSLIIIVNVIVSQRGRVPTIRRIAGLNAIDEAIGRATEMGRPAMMIPGITPLDIPTLQGLSILGYIARLVAGFGSKVIMPTADPIVKGVAEETVRDAYADAGRSELFEDDDVRYLTTQQFAFAAGVAGILKREKPGASFFFGNFYAESLIFAEVGQQIGTVQVAGTPQTEQIPFFLAACDYVIIGDEYYAASAYLSKNPTYLGSIVGQDICKLFLIALILFGVVAVTFIHGFQGHPGMGAVTARLQHLLDLLKY